jgi:hypothetical protein
VIQKLKKNMNPRKAVALLALSISACVTPSFAQVYWNNQSPAGLTDDVWCATYANGTFAAVTNQGNVLTSTDGLTWSTQSVAAGTWLVSIAYGNGTWVAVGSGGSILVSSDLKTWVSAKAVTSNRLDGVLYNGSIWCAVGEQATIITSTDAINWTVVPVPSSLGVTGFLRGIAWDPVNSVFIIDGAQTHATPLDTGGVQMQLSGNTLSLILPAQPNPIEAVVYETEASPSTVPNTVAASTGTIIEGSYGIGGVGPGGSYTVAVPNVIYRGLAYGDGNWVAAGEQGTILSSTDGLNWTQRFSGNSPSTLSTSTLLCVAFSPTLQRFVATGTGGTILVSNAAPTTFANVSTRGYVSSAQTFIGGFVIEGSGPRTVLIRGDGPTLSTFGVTNSLPDPVLTVFNSSGTVVATNTGWTTNTTPSAISTAALEVGAFALPNPSLDSALLLTLQPGAYTVQITSAKGNSGIALFEAYTD